MNVVSFHCGLKKCIYTYLLMSIWTWKHVRRSTDMFTLDTLWKKEIKGRKKINKRWGSSCNWNIPAMNIVDKVKCQSRFRRCGPLMHMLGNGTGFKMPACFFYHTIHEEAVLDWIRHCHFGGPNDNISNAISFYVIEKCNTSKVWHILQ